MLGKWLMVVADWRGERLQLSWNGGWMVVCWPEGKETEGKMKAGLRFGEAKR